MSIKTKIPYSAIKIVSQMSGRLSGFDSLHPLNNGSEDTQQPFFIVGCGRSGNTLLRAMLVAGEQVIIPPESYVIPKIVRLFYHNQRKQWDQLCEIIITCFESHEEFYTWNLSLENARVRAKALSNQDRYLTNILDILYEEYAISINSSASRWGDKTPTNALFIEHIEDLYPQAQYIHLVRDPRAVVNSFKKLKPNSKLDTLCERWLTSNKKLLALRERTKPNNYIKVHYERLLANPETELNAVCQFLNINYSSAMLEFWRNEQLGDVDKHSHHSSVRNPLDESKTESWKNQLTKSEIEIINAKCLSLYEQLNAIS